MPNAGFATRSLLLPTIEEFERKYPEIKIHLTVHPWSLSWNRFMDVIKGRNTSPAPDVLQVGTTWITTLGHLGALEPVPAKEFPGITGSIGDVSPSCVPWFIDLRVLYFRRDVFDALQIDTHLLQDWKGFNRACLEIQKGLAKGNRFPRMLAPLGMPGQKPGVLMHDLAPWVWEAGGDFCSDDLKEANLNQPSFLQGCAFYFDLIDQSYMPLPNTALPVGNFFSGHYAMQFSGSWPIDTYLNPSHPLCLPEVAMGFSVAPVPAGPNGRFTFLGGSNLAVSSTSPNKDASWAFIQFLLEPERQLKHARLIGALPARLPGMDELFKSHPTAKDIFFSSFGYARRLPRLVELGSIEQIVYKMGGRVLASIRDREYNHKRLQQEINTANNEIKTLLSINRYGTRNVGAAA